MKKIALINGITSQDGKYLAELLLVEGYSIIGAVRNITKATASLPSEIINKVQLVEWNMLGEAELLNILSQYRPTELYNFSAFTSGASMFENPARIGEINGLGVVHILEAIRKIDKNIRFCQASTSEIFAEALENPRTERTECIPRSPYGAAKLYADSFVKIYRRKYQIFACSAILFNHESPQRGLNFVTRKITTGAVKIKLGLADELTLGNLDTFRDWGFAGDYVNAMWLMLQQKKPDDFVLSTGVAHSVREFCECAFSYLDLDYREFVKIDPKSYRDSESVILVGNSDKAKRHLNWVPKVHFRELVKMMVESDLKEYKLKIKNEF